ncbi:MAG TPA: DUF4157 domain-containing protein [Kineosporiaceae bacterium]|nr:DUF4157 domain-containing protein [Kineosporiaceae bacterium]
MAPAPASGAGRLTPASSGPRPISRPQTLTGTPTGPRPISHPRATHAATAPPAPSAVRPSPSPPARSPEQSWRAAVRNRPLEPARPLPSGLRTWARRLSGRTSPRVTSGPATRAALAASGAVAAATGDVVHLPAMPSARAGRTALVTLAHELIHLRQPVTRPRFALAAPTGALDLEERATRGLADRVLPPRLSGLTGSALTGSRSATPPLPGRLGGPASGVASVPGLAAASLAGAGALSRPAPPVGAGIVGDLPVTTAGLAGVPSAAASMGAAAGRLPAALAGVSGAGPAGPPGSAALQQAFTEAASGGGIPLADDLGSGEAFPGLGSIPGAAARAVPGGFAAQASALPASFSGPAAPGGSGGAPAGSPAPGPAAWTAGAATADPAAPVTAPGPLPEHVVDGLLDALEQRVLAELERRGGRYAEVF